MRQLIFDLMPALPPSLNNFTPGSNGEALAALSAWLSNGVETGFFLWGEPGSGRSHLLRASGLAYADAAQDPALAELPAGSGALAVDNVECLEPLGQIALFNHFNHMKSTGGKLLAAALRPPIHLNLREDLRTRLGSGLIYRLRSLSDTEKAAALAAQARARALGLPPEIIDYLIRHTRRDMGALSGMVAALAEATLEQRRPVTLPLVRELLQSLKASPETRP